MPEERKPTAPVPPDKPVASTPISPVSPDKPAEVLKGDRTDPDANQGLSQSPPFRVNAVVSSVTQRERGGTVIQLDFVQSSVIHGPDETDESVGVFSASHIPEGGIKFRVDHERAKNALIVGKHFLVTIAEQTRK